MYRQKVLIVEDLLETCVELRNYLQNEGYEAITAADEASAERLWRTVRPDLAIVDCDLHDGSAASLIPRLRLVDHSLPVIVLASYSSIEVASEAVRLGAEQFLTKPVELSTLRIVVERSLENQRNRRTRLAETARLGRQVLDPFQGKSEIICRFRDQAQRVALSESPALLEGETGTGKGVLARWLHQNGPRASEPFVDLNCAGFRPTLIDSELFGDERETFTENLDGKPALLEIAHRGTLLLDAIGELHASIQPKLLRLLELKQFCRLGSSQDRRVDVRVVATTHQPLLRLVHSRQFRSDLYFRLRTISLSVPPLRDRAEDIPAIANSLLENLGADLGTGRFELSRTAIAALQGYLWPGNIRELRTVLERAVLVATESVLTEKDLNFNVAAETNVGGGQLRTLEEIERSYIHQVLKKEGGNVESAAKKLGIPRSSLYHKLKQYRESQAELRTVS